MTIVLSDQHLRSVWKVGLTMCELQHGFPLMIVAAIAGVKVGEATDVIGAAGASAAAVELMVRVRMPPGASAVHAAARPGQVQM
jgi:hypothetical protein